MESEKHNNSGDQQEKSSDEEARTGRSYDCNFCKRGFTNAQALGGHMNIHRKDKDKAKRNSKEPSSSSSSSLSPRRRLFSTELLPHFRGGQTTYQVYLPPTPTYYQHGYNPFDYQASWTCQGNSVIEDHGHGGLDLSLNFGTPSHVDQFGERGNEIDGDDNSELDLELRLGNHHPR